MDAQQYALAQLNQLYSQYVQQVNGYITTVPIELTNATGTYLNHLNEYCLMEIFSKSLNLMDFLSLAETCKLFKRLTQRLFPKRLTFEHRFCGNYIKSNDLDVSIISAHDAEKIFKIFGSSFIALSVHEYALDMNLVANHCVAGTLKELEITDMKIPEVLEVQLKPILKHLQLLSITNEPPGCRGKNVFMNCNSLIELRISGGLCNSILHNNFPKLQRFSFDYKKMRCSYCIHKHAIDYNPQCFSEFIRRHTTLKYLNLSACPVNLKEINCYLKFDNFREKFPELEIIFRD